MTSVDWRITKGHFRLWPQTITDFLNFYITATHKVSIDIFYFFQYNTAIFCN